MARLRNTLRFRQLAIYGLILFALTLLSAVGYVIATGRNPSNDPAEEWREEVVVPASAPAMEFPERLRTYNSEVNRLIDRFIRTTRAGQYSEFRKMWTRKLDPISADSYERIYGKVREVAVVDVRPMPATAGSKDRSYVLTARVQVADVDKTDRPTRTIRIRIVREGDEWVFAPVAKPADDAARGNPAAP